MFTENETKTVAHVIRKVRIHVKDPLVEELRPKVPYEKPPRVSVDKAVTKIIDGLPLDAWGITGFFGT